MTVVATAIREAGAINNRRDRLSFRQRLTQPPGAATRLLHPFGVIPVLALNKRCR